MLLTRIFFSGLFLLSLGCGAPPVAARQDNPEACSAPTSLAVSSPSSAPAEVPASRPSLASFPMTAFAEERQLEAALTSRAMSGPYASLDELCTLGRAHFTPALEKQREGEGDVTPGEVFCEEDVVPGLKLTGAISEAHILRIGWRLSLFPDGGYYLALNTKDGWFVSGMIHLEDAGNTAWFKTNVAGLSSANINGAQLITIRTSYLETGHMTDWEKNHYIEEAEETQREILCGLGASGAPSCTGGFVVLHSKSKDISDGGEQLSHHEERFELSVTPSNNSLTISRKSGKLPPEQKKLLGAHALSF